MGERVVSWAGIGWAGASAALAGWLAWRSLGWPLAHDAPLMHYVAWLMAEGGVPYRDVFDMNLPGVYWIHRALLAAGGDGDLAWRLFDLGWLAATCALLYVYCRPLGERWAAAGPAFLFALYHLSGGAWRAGQRDFLLGLPLLAGALGVACSVERRGALVPLGWGGLLLGAAMAIKPYPGLFWLAMAAVAGGSARRSGRSPWAAAATLLGAGLVVPGLLALWLAWRGGLGPFLDVLAGYVLPLYSQVGRVAFWEPFAWYHYGWALWGLLAALALLGLGARVAPAWRARRLLLALGAGYGALHFALQGKGWEYQLYPLALFGCALAAPALAGRPPRAARPVPWRRPAVVALSAALALVLGAKGADAVEAPWMAEKARRVGDLVRDLGPLVPAGGTAQVLDVTEGGIHALLRLRLAEPTRFIYDFHFYHHAEDPRVRALRAELLRDLAARPPAAVVVLRDTWNRPGYERLRDFPALAAWLEQGYALAVEGDGYRIYAQRGRP